MKVGSRTGTLNHDMDSFYQEDEVDPAKCPKRTVWLPVPRYEFRKFFLWHSRLPHKKEIQASWSQATDEGGGVPRYTSGRSINVRLSDLGDADAASRRCRAGASQYAMMAFVIR